jgi:hypothetical protein
MTVGSIPLFTHCSSTPAAAVPCRRHPRFRNAYHFRKAGRFSNANLGGPVGMYRCQSSVS